MNIEELREAALSLPMATERCPFGPDLLAFEIGGKMFCMVDLSGQWDFYNIKVQPDYSVELRERYESVRPAYHMNKVHWVSVSFRGDVPSALHRELLAHAWRQTALGLSRKRRAELHLDL